MDMRVTKRYAAMLVAAGVAGMAPTLTGCGAPESKSTGTPASSSTPSSTATPATAGVPGTIDVNNPTELAEALKSVGVDMPAAAPIENERGTLDGVVFPTWPAGEVRKAGLSTYRIDASESYDSDGTLKFMDKSKVLYEAPFKPQLTATIAPIPPVVLEALKTGDTVTWGVWFSGKKSKTVTAKFTVIDKPAAAKEVSRLDAEKSVTKLGRDLAKGQSLKNYSLFSEALVIYATVAKENPSITTAYTSIMECLRSMKLKNTPLFEDAKSKAVGQVTRQSARFGNGGEVALGSALGRAPNGPTPTPSSDGGGKSGFGPGGAGFKTTDKGGTPYGQETPTDTATLANNAATHLIAFVSGLQKKSEQANEEAKLAKAKADESATAAAAAKTNADALMKKATDDLAKAQDMTNGLSNQERANLMQQGLQEQAAAGAALEAAKALADDASKSKLFADDAQARADAAAKEAANAPQYMQTADGAIVAFKQGTPQPEPGKLPDDKLAQLKALAVATHDAALSAQTRLGNAITALSNALAAQAALQARISDGDPTNDPTAAEVTATQFALNAAAAEKASAQQGNIDATQAASEAAAALAAVGG